MNAFLIVLPLLAPAASAAPAVAGPSFSAPITREEESRNVALDVEILRRLIVQSINDTSPAKAPEVRSSSPRSLLTDTQLTRAWNYTLFSNSVSGMNSPRVGHSRGFHMPGLGAVYSLDVTLPVVEVEPPREEESEEDYADDAWRRMEREVQGTSQSTTAYSNLLFAVRDANEKQYAIDEDAIDDIRDAVIATLSSHGGRIDALRTDESIVIALHVTPATSPMTLRSNEDDNEEISVSWLTGYAALNAQPVHIVIRLAATELEGGLESARRRAAIHRY